ncbi:MAG TPA: ABC transporter ATP-binding protein, partial [Clostridiaceae bacterium]|nr:ABC transporter ATP-binding protein [Clostridiaceae bacterium]
MIEVSHLKKRYGSLLAVDDLSFSVEKGEVFGLLGPNGSGKTTAINCMLSLLSYESGDIKIFGKEMRPDAYDIKKDIGVVMQNVAIFPELSVYENIDYFCGLYITDKKTRKTLVEEAIAFTGLHDFRKFLPRKLSGGLLRRL